MKLTVKHLKSSSIANTWRLDLQCWTISPYEGYPGFLGFLEMGKHLWWCVWPWSIQWGCCFRSGPGQAWMSCHTRLVRMRSAGPLELWFPILVLENLQHCSFLMSLLSDTHIWGLGIFTNELMSWIRCVLLGRLLKCTMLYGGSLVFLRQR